MSALIAIAGSLLLIVPWRWGRMFWLDEEMIAINIRDRSMVELAGPLSLGQAAPYLWLVAERALLLGFGSHERVLRFLPMACGVATLATAFWIGRRWMRAAGGLTLVFLCAAGQWLSFHALELKHYSADAWFGLLLPALAVWAVEADGGNRGAIHRRRVAAWWAVAAAAQWLANGALFVAPGCAFVLVFVAARRGGWRGALTAALPGLLWLAAFAANYHVALAPARASDFLRSYWANAFPPAGARIAGTVQWLAGQLQPLAIKPGGSGYGVLLWAAAAAGFACAPGYPVAFRLAFALVPFSAFVWAGIRLVPMFERLSLWIVPALYVGVAMAADAVAAWLQDARARPSMARTVAGLAPAGLLLAMLGDILVRGTTYLALEPYVANHETDDRGAVRWLARQRQPGDVWVTTRHALPAIWWYGGADDPTPAVESLFHTDPRDCGADEIGASLRGAGARRALVYLGFGHEVPPEFDDALVARLATVGSVTAYRMFGESSHAVIVDLQGPPTGPVTLAALKGNSREMPARPVAGCIAVEPARRW